MGNPAERDPLERGLFRRSADGAIVFFPWGLTGRGYRLPGPAAKRKALRAVSLLLATALAVAAWMAQALQPLLPGPAGSAEVIRALAAPGLALLAAVGGYALWVARFVEPFPPSDLVVPRHERLREAAALAEPRKLLCVGLVVAGLGLLVLALDPEAAWPGALAIATGAGLALWARALMRAAAAGDAPDRAAR